ncbi:MAG: hypothetical protein ACXVLQ_00990 [Bacteriovorax sp.]
MEKYFLTDIPSWANFDQRAACYRSTGIRYFDIDAMMKSFGLGYDKALQVQASFNEEYAQLKQSDKKHQITLKEEELLFYRVNEKVGSKIIFFESPSYKRVNLVWLDEVMGDAKKEKKLKAFLNSKVMEEGVPVLISFCLTRQEAEKRYPDLNAKMITAELFSIFDKSGKRSPGFKIDLGEFFTVSQKLYFYSQKNTTISEAILGLYKSVNY